MRRTEGGDGAARRGGVAGLMRPVRLALAIGFATVAAVLVSTAPPAAADSCDGVWVVVDATALGGSVTTRCAPGDPGSGLDALTAVGHRYDFVPRVPGFVCQIDARPDPCNGAPTDAYWSYWTARQGGTWSYASQGAARDVVPGDVEGWRFGNGSQPPGVAPPAPPPPPPPPPSDPGGESSGGSNGSGSSGASSGASGGSGSGGTGSGSGGSGSGGSGSVSGSAGSGSGSNGASSGIAAGGASGTGGAGAATSSTTDGSSDAAASDSDHDADAAGREPSGDDPASDPAIDVGDEQVGTDTGAGAADGPDESARSSDPGSTSSDPDEAAGPGPEDEVVLAGADGGGAPSGLLVTIAIVVGLLGVAAATRWRRRSGAA
jgi:hypothetical protein